MLRRPEVASAIIGATRPEQVHANAKASGIRLTPDTLAAIEEALGDIPVKQPTLAPWRDPASPTGAISRSARATVDRRIAWASMPSDLPPRRYPCATRTAT